MLLGVGVAVVGVLLLWWSTNLTPGPWQSVVEQTGGLLIGSVALGFLWELGAKRNFRNEILATSKLGSQVDVLGLSWAGEWDDLEIKTWDELFSGASKVDIFFAYGSTWRNSHNPRLRELVRRAGVELNVYLPDPAKDDVMTPLASRFGGMPADKLVEKITDSAADFYRLRQPNGANIQVHFFSKDSTFTIYRFDGAAVMALYSHQVDRDDVPAFVCVAGGKLYEFLDKQLSAIKAQSRVAPSP